MPAITYMPGPMPEFIAAAPHAEDRDDAAETRAGEVTNRQPAAAAGRPRGATRLAGGTGILLLADPAFLQSNSAGSGFDPATCLRAILLPVLPITHFAGTLLTIFPMP